MREMANQLKGIKGSLWVGGWEWAGGVHGGKGDICDAFINKEFKTKREPPRTKIRKCVVGADSHVNKQTKTHVIFIDNRNGTLQLNQHFPAPVSMFNVCCLVSIP